MNVPRLLDATNDEAAVVAGLEQVARGAGFPFALAWQVERDTGVLRMVSAFHDPAWTGAPAFEACSRGMTFTCGEGLPGRAWARGEPVWIHDVTLDPLFPRAPLAQQEGLRAGVGCPLSLRGEIVGVMEMFRPGTCPPDEGLLAELPELTAPLAQAVALYRAEEEQRRLGAGLRLLCEMGLAQTREAAQQGESFLKQAASMVVGAALADWCLISLLEGSAARTAASAHVDPQKAPLLRDVRLARYPGLDNPASPLGRVLRTGNPLVLHEVSEGFLAATIPDPEVLALLRAAGVRTGLIVPLIDQGRTFGAMTLVASRPERRFSGADVALAEEIARRLASTLGMVQKDQELREARRAAEAATARTERLQSITARLSSALTVEEVADVSVGHARAAIGAAGGSVCLLDEGGTELVVVRAVGYSDEVLEPWQRMPLSLPVPIPEAVRTGKPIFLDSKQDYIARYPALAGAKFENGDGAFAVMPLCVEDRVLGAMGLSFSSARRIDADERLFLETVAQHCAQALERARLYDAERRARAENARLYLESQRAVQAREDLLAIVSHDLRNPLGAIKLNAAQIARDTADERTARKGAIMMRAVERMERLIRDLLDAASIEAGRLSLELGRHDARALVEEIVELFTPLAAPKGIQLEAQLPESEVWVRCDRERVLQVLSNLVGNALKFTPEGGQVTVHLCHDEGVACLAISDTGPGIRADHLPHIFDRYWRGGSKVAGGAGLGLYIAQGIVSAHGGRIEVESEPGTGTTFRFSLALANEAPEASE